MHQREQLREQLRKTLSTYALGLPVSAVISELRKIGDELTQIALQTTDSGVAINDFAVDIHGTVRKKEK